MLKWILSISALILFFYLLVPYLISSMSTDDYYDDTNIKNLSVDPGHRHYYELEIDGKPVHFDLLDPGMAPKEIREIVEHGFNIINYADVYASEYVGSKMTCKNCHFCGGNTFGGKNGSISLVGAPFWFPEYSKRDGKEIYLEDRINNCFMRSLNGKPLPKNSSIMKALVVYFDWISHEVKKLPEYPWRGLKPLTVEHVPNTMNGKKIYEEKCALCHNHDGSGSCELGCTVRFPPLWGDDSFNDGAGMARLEKMASFVHCNMPYKQPSLTEEESIDVSAFVLQQPRPHFVHP